MSQDTEDKRHYFRHSIHFPIRLQPVHSSGGQPLAKTQCTDFSEAGLSFIWTHPLTVGTLLNLSIPVKNRVFKLNAHVAYASTTSKPDLFHIGVSFQDTTSAFKAKIAEELLEIQKYQKNMARDAGHEISEQEAAEKWIEKFAAHFAHLF